jgi:hypothetical protein
LALSGVTVSAKESIPKDAVVVKGVVKEMKSSAFVTGVSVVLKGKTIGTVTTSMVTCYYCFRR